MTSDDDGRNRRRHERMPTAEPVALTLAGAAVAVVRVLDVSEGGLLVELPPGARPPPLHARGLALLASRQRKARVVRIRWGGRDRGERVPPALALVFEEP